MGHLSETSHQSRQISDTRRRFEAEIAARQLCQLGLHMHVAAVIDPFAQSTSGNVAPASDCGR